VTTTQPTESAILPDNIARQIVLPEGHDRDLDELMRKWREAKPYNPRRDMA